MMAVLLLIDAFLKNVICNTVIVLLLLLLHGVLHYQTQLPTQQAQSPQVTVLPTAAVVDVAADTACADGTYSTSGQQFDLIAGGDGGATSGASGDAAADSLAGAAWKQQEAGKGAQIELRPI